MKKWYVSRYLTLRCVQTWGDKSPEDFPAGFLSDSNSVCICANFPPWICPIPHLSTGRGNGHSPPSWFSISFMILWTSLVFFLSSPFPGWGKLLYLVSPIWSYSVSVFVFTFAWLVSFSLGKVDPSCIPRGWRPRYRKMQGEFIQWLCMCRAHTLNVHIHVYAHTLLVSAAENSKFD